MVEPRRNVILKDSTLREAMDTPGVSFSVTARIEIARLLESAGVAEAEVVAPSRVIADLEIARLIKAQGLGITTSGLIYAHRDTFADEAREAVGVLDRVDLIMPLSERRQPSRFEDKVDRLLAAIDLASGLGLSMGVGFPHSTQVAVERLVEISELSASRGAGRITIYDTNGSAEPFALRDLMTGVASAVEVPVFFHGHNDLGLAVANSWAAVLAGAAGLDVTINGLGDRAGNASLEQLVLLLHLHGMETGVETAQLHRASRLVERLSGVEVSKLAPVVGDFVFEHLSPGHFGVPGEFEAFDPKLIGRRRRVRRDQTH
jgi:isopropylmalate/homocitrate/citramalate synthase